MRMMVLYTYGFHSSLRKGPTSGEIIGMKVIRDDRRPNFENVLQVRYRILKKLVSLDIFEVTNMLAKKSLAPPQHADSAL
jgi:hypothetical protein